MSLERLLLRRLRGSDYLLFGEKQELDRLFGTPLPRLPRPSRRPDGSETFFVDSHQSLRDTLERFISSIAARIEKAGSEKGTDPGRLDCEDREYESVLLETLGSVIKSDRRLGLINLFWLVHSGEISEQVEKFFTASGSDDQLRYQIHPLLAGFYHRMEKSFHLPEQGEAVRARYRLGAGSSRRMIDTIMDDQFPLVRKDMKQFDAETVLIPRNRRFRIGAAAFQELRDILTETVREGVARHDRGLLEVLNAVGPSPSPGEVAETGRLDRYIFQKPVVQYLLQDIDKTPHEIIRTRTLRRERDRLGGWQALLGHFYDVTESFLRSQVIFCLRGCISDSRRSLDEEQMRKMYAGGDVYRFSPNAEVVANVRNVSVLFADLRDFTRASEGLISERGLAEELYGIFDPAAIAIGRFGGRIDKYLGDGFMATFGVDGSPRGSDPLSPARAALAIQHMLSRLRDHGKSSFQMGIGLHTGIAAVARFLLDDDREEITPIGRQVNIAGRLCSAKGVALEMSEEEARKMKESLKAAGIMDSQRSVGGVTVDSDGNLINTGIAVSGGLIDSVRTAYELREERVGGRSYNISDAQTGLEIKFDYVGDARFKGLEGTVAIYSLSAEANRDS